MANRAPTAPYDYDKVRTTISDRELAQAAYNAGFRGEALTKAVAIALAESHGNRTALNDHGEFSVGLWQINLNGDLASRLRRFGLSGWQDLWNANNNAKAAYDVSGGGKHFNAWTTYSGGTFFKYMGRATTAVQSIGASPTGGVTSKPPNNPRPKWRDYVPTGTGAGYNPKAQYAKDFLIWWNGTGFTKHDALTNWNDILSRFQTDTGNANATAFIRDELTKANIPLDVAIGLGSATTDNFLIHLSKDFLSIDDPGDVGTVFEPDQDLLGIGSFFGDLLQPIAHAFYFVIFIIIAIALLIVGVMAGKAKKE